MRSTTATVLPFPQHRGARVLPGHQGPRPGRAGVRLQATRRGRALAVLAAFLLGLLVAGAALLLLDIPSALAGSEPAPAVTVTVDAGDTLSGYAEQYAPSDMSDQEFVEETRALNHLVTPRLTEGQSIVLPEGSLAGR